MEVEKSETELREEVASQPLSLYLTHNFRLRNRKVYLVVTMRGNTRFLMRMGKARLLYEGNPMITVENKDTFFSDGESRPKGIF